SCRPRAVRGERHSALPADRGEGSTGRRATAGAEGRGNQSDHRERRRGVRGRRGDRRISRRGPQREGRGVRRLAPIVVLGVAVGSAAFAQSKSTPPSMGNTASVRTHLEALHYQGIQGLRRGPDGQWTGTALQGNVPKTVTVRPDGTVIAR